MPRNKPENIGVRDSVEGAAIGLPLVQVVSAIQSHTVWRITWHAHDKFELLFVLNGSTVYEFKKHPPVELSGGQFMVVPPGVEHRGEHDLRMRTTLIGIVLAPDEKGVTRNTPFTTRELKWLRHHFKANSLTVHPLGQRLLRTITKLSKNLSRFDKQNKNEMVGMGMRLSLCSTIFEAAQQLTAVDIRDSQLIVNAAIDYMQTNFGAQLSIDNLVNHVGYSRSRFFELFKSNTGMTPNDYLQRLRLESARSLLAETSRSVTDIAFEVGFNSSQYFSTVFLQYTGLTPSGFRSHDAH